MLLPNSHIDDGHFKAGRVHLLSITLDPARDTPEVLRQYMKLYDAEPAHWTFLTGAPDKVAKTIADRTNETLHGSFRGPATDVATAETKSVVLLRVAPQYRLNLPRYLRVVRQILGQETGVLRSLGAVPVPLAQLGQPPSVN